MPKKEKKFSAISFTILGGRDSTRALQSSPFHNPGEGSPEPDEGGVQRTEILVSNIGYIYIKNLTWNFFPTYLLVSPAGSLANSCYPATWGRPVWRRQPFVTHVALPPFFDMDSIHRLWYSNLQPVCQRLEFHTHTHLLVGLGTQSHA